MHGDGWRDSKNGGANGEKAMATQNEGEEEIRLYFGRTFLWIWLGAILPGLLVIEAILFGVRAPMIIEAFFLAASLFTAIVAATLFQYAYRFQVSRHGLRRSLRHIVPFADQCDQEVTWHEIAQVRSLLLIPLCHVSRYTYGRSLFLIPHPWVVVNREVMVAAFHEYASAEVAKHLERYLGKEFR